MFAQIGVRGASVIFSSGDGGVGAGTCETNDGTNRVLFQPVRHLDCDASMTLVCLLGISSDMSVRHRGMTLEPSLCIRLADQHSITNRSGPRSESLQNEAFPSRREVSPYTFLDLCIKVSQSLRS